LSEIRTPPSTDRRVARGTRLADPAGVPWVVHEAPLLVLREEPGLVPELLRESLGVELPPYVTVEVSDQDFTQAVPTERRADLVLHLRAGPPDARPVMGVIVEIQRARDEAKRRSWPLYLAALHARLRCATCLVVLTTDDSIARWAARPITSLQPGSPFTPLVLGPEHVPRPSVERAMHEPWLAVLAGLVHGNRPDGARATLTAFAALSSLTGDEAATCYDLLRATLDEAARRVLEQEMLSRNHEYQSDFARRYFGEGRQQGRLEEARELLLCVAARHALADDELAARVVACDDRELLRELTLALAACADRTAAERIIARLPTARSDH
jgi:hypothetical protein